MQRSALVELFDWLVDKTTVWISPLEACSQHQASRWQAHTRMSEHQSAPSMVVLLLEYPAAEAQCRFVLLPLYEAWLQALHQVEWTLLGGNEALLDNWHCVPTRRLWKDVRTHLLDTMAFSTPEIGGTSECCMSSSKNISTLINSLQRHHLNNQILKTNSQQISSTVTPPFTVIEDKPVSWRPGAPRLHSHQASLDTDPPPTPTAVLYGGCSRRKTAASSKTAECVLAPHAISALHFLSEGPALSFAHILLTLWLRTIMAEGHVTYDNMWPCTLVRCLLADTTCGHTG